MQGLGGVLDVWAGRAIGAGRSSSINPKLGWRFGGRLLADCSLSPHESNGPEAEPYIDLNPSQRGSGRRIEALGALGDSATRNSSVAVMRSNPARFWKQDRIDMKPQVPTRSPPVGFLFADPRHAQAARQSLRLAHHLAHHRSELLNRSHCKSPDEAQSIPVRHAHRSSRHELQAVQACPVRSTAPHTPTPSLPNRFFHQDQLRKPRVSLPSQDHLSPQQTSVRFRCPFFESVFSVLATGGRSLSQTLMRCVRH